MESIVNMPVASQLITLSVGEESSVKNSYVKAYIDEDSDQLVFPIEDDEGNLHMEEDHENLDKDSGVTIDALRTTIVFDPTTGSLYENLIRARVHSYVRKSFDQDERLANAVYNLIMANLRGNNMAIPPQDRGQWGFSDAALIDIGELREIIQRHKTGVN